MNIYLKPELFLQISFLLFSDCNKRFLIENNIFSAVPVCRSKWAPPIAPKPMQTLEIAGINATGRSNLKLLL